MMGLRLVRNHFQDTAVATLVLTCGKSDRGHNEVQYLRETLDMMDSLLNRDTHDGFVVIVTERLESS